MHEAIDEDTGGVDIFRIDPADRNELVDLRDRIVAGHRHYNIKISHGFAKGDIAEAVATMRANESKIRMQRLFEDVFTPVDDTAFLAFRQLRAGSGGSEKPAQTGTRGTNPLGQSALRNELEFDLALQIEILERDRPGIVWEGRGDFANAAVLDQATQRPVSCTGTVVDNRQIFDAFAPQGLEQLTR
jgi:hypothetical protein